MTKYRNKKLTTPDGTFDSQREYKRWCELKLLQKAGKISQLQRQVKYVLIPRQKRDDGTFERPVTYIADFQYYDGSAVVEDSKGVRTDAYIIKRKLMLWIRGITVRDT